MQEKLLVFNSPHKESIGRPTVKFADVVHEAAETEAPYMPDEPNRAFESECRVKVFMQTGISLLTA